MGKILKWVGIVIGGLVVVVLLAVVVVYTLGRAKFSQNANVGHPVTIPTSAEAVARGKYLASSVMGCDGCHGPGLQGQAFFDPAVVPNSPPFGILYAPNLTTGQSGVGSMSDAQFERAIRHGIGEDGRTLLIMPSQEYTHLTDEDFGALIAYIKTLPPSDAPTKPRALSFMAYVLAGAGQLGQLPYEQIDQNAAPVASLAASTSAEYGQYLSHIAACRDCHGVDLKGAVDPETGAPTPSLTNSGEVGGWTVDQFLTALHTGARPDGSQLSEAMPWMAYGTMTDNDLTAIYNYLHTLN
ncbi:MAG: c-type cytochrome [Anaerolineales bacterium]|nr:c-type cytochrome [Anaerolineales bacterium]